MVRRILLCTALTLAVAACERRVEPAPKPAPAAAPAAPAVSSAATTVYACANGAAARASYPDAQTAIVDYQGRTYTLKATPAASGARYVGEGLQWWTQGPVNAAVSPLGVGGTMAKGGVVACTAQGRGPSADAPLAPPAPGQPGGLPDDRTPVSEAPFTPESPQGAANVVQTYYALVEAGKYADAWKLWGDGGKASGQSPAEFAAGFGKFKDITPTSARRA